MNKIEKAYEPPKMKVYRFDDDDQILTASNSSSGGGGGSTTKPTADYAARALNDLFNGTSTTIEK